MALSPKQTFHNASENEAIGTVLRKIHHKHEIMYRIERFTYPAHGVGHMFPPSIREIARKRPGVVLVRLDDNSKAEPKGTLVWRIRSFVDDWAWNGYHNKGFRIIDSEPWV